MSPLQFQIFKYVFVVCTVGFVWFEFNTFRTKSWNIRLILLMAFCYPLGKAIEFWLIGPDFLRGHLSDFGFVPFFAYYGLRESSYIPVLRDLSTWRIWKVTATCALGIAVFVELIEILGQHIEIARHAPSRGDPVDMACYFVSFGLLLFMARRQVTAYEAAHAENLEYQRQAAESDILSKRARRRERDRAAAAKKPTVVARRPGGQRGRRRRKPTMGPRGGRK